MGAEQVVDVSTQDVQDAQRALVMKEGFDVEFQMSSVASALPAMIENMNHGGRIAMLGLSSAPFGVNWGKIDTHMLTIKGIYGREMFETWNAMGGMLQTSPILRAAISRIIAEVIPARDWVQGFDAAAAAGTGKIILDWTAVREKSRTGEERDMYGAFREHLAAQLAGIDEAALPSVSAASEDRRRAEIVADGADVLNFCANNYLGLADDPRIVEAAKGVLEEWGYGLASVRFICGTQEQHLELERWLPGFSAPRASSTPLLLLPSCFDANGGVFETLFSAEDAIISEELNHASIIDGIRLSKARRLRYRNRDLSDVEDQLRVAAAARVIVTDGLRPRRALRSAGLRRRLARGRVRRRARSRHAGAVRRRRSRRHLHRHVRQGARCRLRRVRGRAPRRRRLAAPTIPSVPVLEHARLVDRRRDPGRPRPGRELGGCGVGCGRTPHCSEADGRGRLRASSRGAPPSSRSCAATRRSPHGSRRRCNAKACTPRLSASPSSPRDLARIRVQLSAAHTSEQVERCVAARAAVVRGL